MKPNKKDTAKLQKFFEEKDFVVHLFVQDKQQCAEVENWTDGGVDMIITLMPFEAEKFIEYADDFDIDEEIDCHRQDKCYKNAFTITQSVEDFTNFHDMLKEVAEELKKQ